jgi:hypothetical protein
VPEAFFPAMSIQGLPISVGILAWRSGSTLSATLKTYVAQGLTTLTDDMVILFQECSAKDRRLARRFGIQHIALTENVGIGRGFELLAKQARYETVLLLEHDWHLVEPLPVTRQRLAQGLELLADGVDCVRYRHRIRYGEPHFGVNHYRGREEVHVDPWVGGRLAHLIDFQHWIDRPEERWPDLITRRGDYLICQARYAAWTNNPCIYRRDFYLRVVKPFVGEGMMLEQNITRWWASQSFRVAMGEGLFMHVDPRKYGGGPVAFGRRLFNRTVNKLRSTLAGDSR